MNSYVIVLFLHIIGAAGMFAGIGMEGVVLLNLKKADSVSQVLSIGDSMKIMKIIFGISAVLLLFSGLYLVIESWGWTAWVVTGLVLLISLSGYGSMTGKKIITYILSLNREQQKLPAEAKNIIGAPKLLQSYKIRALLAIAIIFIMTLKPGWVGTISTVIVASLLGVASASTSKEKANELEPA